MRPSELLRLAAARGATPSDLAAALARVLRGAWSTVAELDDRPWLALQALDRWCARASTADDFVGAVGLAAEARVEAAAQVATAAHRADLAGAYYLAVGVHTALQLAAESALPPDWLRRAMRAHYCVTRCLELAGDPPEAASHRANALLRAALVAFLPAEMETPPAGQLRRR